MRRRSRRAGRDDDRDDDILVAAACSGDHDAFAQLFRRHGPDVVRSVERRCGSASTADDVTATAFERAWRSLDQLVDRPGGFRPWLFRIALNELIDVQRSTNRRAQREQRHGLVGVSSRASDDPASVTERDVEGIPVEDVRAAIDTLSIGHQEVISLRWFADLGPSEIAATLEISKGAVAVRTHRAMAALRVALGVDNAEGAQP